MKKISITNNFLDYLLLIAGCAIYSVAVVMFVESSQLSPGGVTGIATVLHFLFGFPVGLLVFIINIPLIIIALIKFGGSFVIKTGFATLTVSVFLTLAEYLISPYKVDTVLSALFGGICMGAGLSLVLLRSATTGGFDIIVKLVSAKHPHLSYGRLFLILDGIVIILTAICYRNFESALYSALCIYISSKTIDFLIYGSAGGKLLLSVTEKPDIVAAEIFKAVGHGATIINAKGSYTGNEKTVLMCAVRRHEAAKVISAVKSADCTAFSVITDVGEISGYGFTGRITS